MLAPDRDRLQRVAFPMDEGPAVAAEPALEPWADVVKRLWPDGDDVPRWSDEA